MITALIGRVTDDEVIAYYETSLRNHGERWLELVDGTGVTEMALTAQGLWRLMQVVTPWRDMLRGGMVAMVAASDATYGMFRMWEMQREAMPYEVRVFRDREQAFAWLVSATGSAA